MNNKEKSSAVLMGRDSSHWVYFKSSYFTCWTLLGYLPYTEDELHSINAWVFPIVQKGVRKTSPERDLSSLGIYIWTNESHSSHKKNPNDQQQNPTQTKQPQTQTADSLDLWSLAVLLRALQVLAQILEK